MLAVARELLEAVAARADDPDLARPSVEDVAVERDLPTVGRPRRRERTAVLGAREDDMLPGAVGVDDGDEPSGDVAGLRIGRRAHVGELLPSGDHVAAKPSSMI